MTVPSRVEAASILRSLHPPAWFLRHACAVAEVSAFLARRVEAQGHRVDRGLVEAAALLHDVDKLPATATTADGVRRPHGAGSAAWLAAAGYPELGPAVAGHPVTRLAEGPATDAWLASAVLEVRIVAYADKRAGQHLEPMAARFAGWRRRYPAVFDPSARAADTHPGDAGADDGPPTGPGWDAATVRAVLARAERLEADVCAAAGIGPADVRRLRWTRRALRQAGRSAGSGIAA